MSWPYDREEEQDQAGAEVELLERPLPFPPRKHCSVCSPPQEYYYGW